MNTPLKTIVKALDDKKAVDITVLKIDDITSLTDYFVICKVPPPRRSKPLPTNANTPRRRSG